MRGARAGPQPGADTMSPRPVSAPVLMGEQPERVRRSTASPALASPGIVWGGVGHAMTPAWTYRHERTRHQVGSTAPRSKSTQGRKSSTVPGPHGRRR
jgi:hypothetical protein